MKTVALIFPHQLFTEHPVLEQTQEVFLIEDSLFFGDPHNMMKFHKKKLVFHIASMMAYKEQLEKKGVVVHYIKYEAHTTIVDILPELDELNIICVDPTDYLLERRLRRRFKQKITFLETPLFINTKSYNKRYLEDKPLFMQEFYKQQRKRLNILMDQEGPIGSRFSFDTDNRKKIPQSKYQEIPKESQEKNNTYICEAKARVNESFAANYGSTDNFRYATTRKEALELLKSFCKERLKHFGDYEDAIVKDASQLYHSMLSPYLNIGLLSPMEVVNTVISHAADTHIPINNTEGIIRQIIGWREFIRMVYEEHGSTIRTNNNWNHTRKISKSWYAGTIGIEPVDSTIKKTLDYAYSHHIERLMIMGNFMFLCECNPHDIYTWFMELHIDSYDWVMVPNVYAMTQNTQKGLMTTKPYISGSNYIKKMSDYSNGTWCDTWDALYWNFVIKNHKELKANGRMHFITSRAASFTKSQKEAYHNKAEKFLREIK